VLPGLDLAVASMLPREVSRFILQPRYGYGPLGVPNLIPAQATIEFEIELMSGNAALVRAHVIA
jgi:FKBP-type peptidyl-prolyl cis-trans isomerase